MLKTNLYEMQKITFLKNHLESAYQISKPDKISTAQTKLKRMQKGVNKMIALGRLKALGQQSSTSRTKQQTDKTNKDESSAVERPDTIISQEDERDEEDEQIAQDEQDQH